MTTSSLPSRERSDERWLPPEISRAEAANARALCREWRGKPADINNVRCELTPRGPGPHPEPLESLVTLTGRVNGVEVNLLAPRTSVLSLAEKIDPRVRGLIQDDDALAPLLDWLTRLDAVVAPDRQDRPDLALEVSFDCSQQASTTDCDALVILRLGEIECILGLQRVPRGISERWLSAWPIAPRTYSFVEFRTRILCGYSELQAGEIGALGVGDVITLDNPLPRPTSRFLTLGAIVFMWDAVEGTLNRIDMNKYVRRMMASVAEDYDGFDSSDEFQAGGGVDEQCKALASEDDLAGAMTRLVFSAGTANVTLEELRTAGIGYVFEINREAGVVDIVLNGRKIGVGHIVRIGETSGVRVTRLLKR